ncbi:hypothetical protein L1987_78723 [Smallanthus sonchifolius]|uniref:Uncharacterized protein n=1 Tax=Smallanthus sonchifolius TaxID=185202 RepID=A0ACB8ZDQ7_9ASTR|nr:hypothetical protein L1987_78723 [Smallanthus sonchifolius]
MYSSLLDWVFLLPFGCNGRHSRVIVIIIIIIYCYIKLKISNPLNSRLHGSESDQIEARLARKKHYV